MPMVDRTDRSPYSPHEPGPASAPSAEQPISWSWAFEINILRDLERDAGSAAGPKKASARDTHSSPFGFVWELGGPLSLCGLPDLHLPLGLLPCPPSLPPQVALKGIVALDTLNSL